MQINPFLEFNKVNKKTLCVLEVGVTHRMVGAILFSVADKYLCKIAGVLLHTNIGRKRQRETLNLSGMWSLMSCLWGAEVVVPA